MKSAVKRIKGILLALMYVALYYAVSTGVYWAYFLWNLAGGNASVSEIQKNASDGSFALAVIAAIICLWIYMVIGKFRHKPLSEQVKNENVPQMVYIMSACLAIGCRFLVSAYYSLSQNIPVLMKSIEKAEEISPGINTAGHMLIALFSVVIAAPLFEELLFRVLVMGELMKIMRPWAAIALQAIIFGIAHGVLFQSLFAILVGVILGVVYYKTKNMKAAVICHLVFNLSSILMQENMSALTSAIYVTAGILLSVFALYYVIDGSKKR